MSRRLSVYENAGRSSADRQSSLITTGRRDAGVPYNDGEISVSKASVRVLAVAGVLFMASCGSSPLPDAAGGGGGKACARSTGPETQGMPSTERIFGWIEGLVATGYRRTGTPSGYAGAAYMKCEFEKLGLQDVHYDEVTSWNWESTRHGLNVNGVELDSFPVSHSFIVKDRPSTFSTGPKGLTAPVIDVGRGIDPWEDVDGKIVVFDLKFLIPTAVFGVALEFFWDPRLTIVDPLNTMLVANPFLTNLSSFIEEAMDRGAVGFVGVLADYFESNQYHNEFYRRTHMTIPGLWVSPGEGERLRAALAAQQPATATLTLEGSRSEVTARTVIGFLHGKSRDTVMVQSHHDSVFDGAVEDASGSASVLAQAQYFASKPAGSLDKTLMFITFDTHFTGYQSHQKFVRRYITEKETPYNIVANVTLEHIARQGITTRDKELVLGEHVEPRAIMENLSAPLKLELINAVVRNNLERMFVLNADVIGLIGGEGGLPTDASFTYVAGVPTVSLIAGPNYLYDAADTLDKVAKEELVPVNQAFAELIEAIDTTPSDRIGLGP
jgi:hypothetical protein